MFTYTHLRFWFVIQTLKISNIANTTCPKMCKFTMSNLKSNGARDLKIKLLFNNVSNNRVVDACANRSPNQAFRELYINCSSWNEGEYGVYEGGFGSACEDSNGLCDRIKNVCVCHCQQGYTMVENNCKRGDLPLNESCTYDSQCLGYPYASCVGGKCSCIKGYSAKDSSVCVPSDLPLNESCTYDSQCLGYPYASCVGGKCSCIKGYSAKDSSVCVPRDLPLNKSCTYESQCLGYPYASCVGGKCSCIKGYSAKDSSVCVPMTKRQAHRADGNKKSLFVAIIGGLLAGRKEPEIRFENHQYDTKGVDDNATPLRETKQENVATKSPDDHSEETVDYSHIHDETRIALTQDDVYHHLNEEEEEEK
ncbi:uncharacterized protein [Magallana gigas]|uniref:uncharacterized protein isoform X5 n=1 Tax=Magallana gigas TaxID=29159 RepID=UPI0033402779